MFGKVAFSKAHPAISFCKITVTPRENIKARNFSARYSTNYTANETGSLTFEVEGDDGYRFMINGKEVINAWTRNRWGARQHKIDVEAGKTYQLTLEYWQGDGKDVSPVL